MNPIQKGILSLCFLAVIIIYFTTPLCVRYGDRWIPASPPPVSSPPIYIPPPTENPSITLDPEIAKKFKDYKGLGTKPKPVPLEATRPFELMATKLLLAGVLGGVSFFLFKGSSAKKLSRYIPSFRYMSSFLSRHRYWTTVIISGIILTIFRFLGLMQGQSWVILWGFVAFALLVWGLVRLLTFLADKG